VQIRREKKKKKKIFSHANKWYSIKLEEDKYDMGENRMAFRSKLPKISIYVKPEFLTVAA
jgi:hypothetical protein